MKYVMYTDGGCRNKIGGWAYVITKDGKEIKKKSGGTPDTTNNKMELTAILEGILNFDFGDEIEIISDSKYALNICFGDWNATTNLDLVEDVRILKEGLIIKTRWVKGHHGDKFNEMCDEMCTSEITKIKEMQK